VKDGAEEVASQERTDDGDNDVEQQVRIIVHDHSCDPTNHRRNDEVYKNVHFYLLYECLSCTEYRVFFINPTPSEGEGVGAPLELFNVGGRSLLLQVSFKRRHVLVDFIGCALAAVTILFLKQASQDLELTGGPIQIIVCEFAPPPFGLASHLFPFAFQYIFVHNLILRSYEKCYPVCAEAWGNLAKKVFLKSGFATIFSIRRTLARRNIDSLFGLA
jgi:hypothetical protein